MLYVLFLADCLLQAERAKHHKYLSEVVVVQNLQKINAKSRSLSLAFGMHLAVFD